MASAAAWALLALGMLLPVQTARADGKVFEIAAPPARIPEPPPGSVLPGGVLQRLQALCVHTPVYGTVSSTLVALAPGRTDRYVYVPGAPCRTAPVDVTALIAL